MILDRALSDPEYQRLLFTNQDEALKGYELSDAEVAMLRNLAQGTYTTTRRGLVETKKLIQAAQVYRTDD
jgi:hypothetical protein